jgi:HEXXH motif-containing protein
MRLLDPAEICRLQLEFRRSMRTLLTSVCLDIERNYAHLAKRLALPADYFRFVAERIDRSSYSNWKVVGWIEALNDLLYFLDLMDQVRHERDRRDFAEQLFDECKEQFFENSYLDELFPDGVARWPGLAGRVQSLCRRLALEVTQESIFLDPQRTFQWMQPRRPWKVPVLLGSSFERAEEAFSIPVGYDGRGFVAPAAVRKAVGNPARRVTLVITADDMVLQASDAHPLCTRTGRTIQWHWPMRECGQASPASGHVTIGPTLHYGKNREPASLSHTDAKQIARIGRAWQAIRRAWPDGHTLLRLLTSRVVPLDAPGVVSFSYRHRPGLSFINCFDRDNLDLIDDLIHENSHHHLNLLLRKQVMYHRDRNQQIFYSPWRRSLRPLRGILHATFTFTMGALLFARLSAWAETGPGKSQWREAGLTAGDLVRARSRCQEEIESVRYSLFDLEHARRLGWVTKAGARLVKQLEAAMASAERHMARHRKAVFASSFGPSLRRHAAELRRARQRYGPINADHA